MAEERAPAEHYRLSLRYILRVILAVLLGQRRDLGPDIRGTLARARPRPRVIDQHNIPEEGPFVFVTNHYERRRSPPTLPPLPPHHPYNFGLPPAPVWLLRWSRRCPARVSSSPRSAGAASRSSPAASTKTTACSRRASARRSESSCRKARRRASATTWRVSG